MDNNKISELIKQLKQLDFYNMYGNDFLLTWEKTSDEIQATFLIAEILRNLRLNNISARFFDSGIGVSIFRDQSTRTRFSYAGACNLLGLTVNDLDESKSQIAHGETVRETANMISFMADAIGIRDDMYIGKGHAYMLEVAEAVSQGFDEGVLEQRPTLVNLQCDMDHPTQSMTDMLHLIDYFGGVEYLKGKKIAMTWAYSPSYGKPLSVPQGIIALMTRFGMDVVLAHPVGYEIMPEVEKIARRNADSYGGSYLRSSSMDEAFEGAHIVYPKSWAPFSAMEKRTTLHSDNDFDGIEILEQELLTQNADHKDWECNEKLMSKTYEGNALYMHCLPADISGVSCKKGEVKASVFDRYRTQLYKQASYKPYIIAAMILLGRLKSPAIVLEDCLKRRNPRFFNSLS